MASLEKNSGPRGDSQPHLSPQVAGAAEHGCNPSWTHFSLGERRAQVAVRHSDLSGRLAEQAPKFKQGNIIYELQYKLTP